MDEIERRIRAARPTSGHRDLPLSDRAKGELSDLVLTAEPLESTSRRAVRGSRQRWVWSGVCVAVAAVAAFLVAPLFAPHATLQDLPPSIVIAASDDREPAEVLDALLQMRNETAPTGEALLDASTSYTRIVLRWDLRARGGDYQRRSEEAATTVRDDGSREVVVRDLLADDPRESVTTSRWEPGEYGGVFADPISDRKSGIGPYLSARIDGDLTTASALRAIGDVMAAQDLSETQTAALLGYLSDRGDLQYEGETLDRLGREALVFAACDSNCAVKQRLLLSPDDGSVLSSESVIVRPEDAALPAGTVIRYITWVSTVRAVG